MYYINSKSNPFGIPKWRITSKVFWLGYSLISLLYNQSNIITNSKYVSTLISSIFKTDSLTIYPPVDVSNIKFISNKKKNVLTVARLSKGKNLKIIPEIVKELRKFNLQYIIMGNVDEKSVSIIKYIIDTSRQYGIEDKIDFILNPNRTEILKKMRESLIYLSTQSTEAFGMALIESMLSSCIPIVPKSGGPWYDILQENEGYAGYAYKTTLEAAKIIETILDNQNNKFIQKNAIRRAKKFNTDIFNKKISILFKKML
jgi:glycosyltransferase involved in cell wall biosynthesis